MGLEHGWSSGVWPLSTAGPWPWHPACRVEAEWLKIKFWDIKFWKAQTCQIVKSIYNDVNMAYTYILHIMKLFYSPASEVLYFNTFFFWFEILILYYDNRIFIVGGPDGVNTLFCTIKKWATVSREISDLLPWVIQNILKKNPVPYWKGWWKIKWLRQNPYTLTHIPLKAHQHLLNQCSNHEVCYA